MAVETADVAAADAATDDDEDEPIASGAERQNVVLLAQNVPVVDTAVDTMVETAAAAAAATITAEKARTKTMYSS